MNQSQKDKVIDMFYAYGGARLHMLGIDAAIIQEEQLLAFAESLMEYALESGYKFGIECKKCNGGGRVLVPPYNEITTDRCPDCNGRGRVRKNKEPT